MRGLDVFVVGAVLGIAVWVGFCRVGALVESVWWPETGDGGDELAGGEPRA